MLCMEVNFGYLINSIDLSKANKFDLGLGILIFTDYEPYYDYSFIYNTNRNLKEIFEVFNSSEYTPEAFVLEEGEFYFSFYHILYFETTKIIKEHPESKVNISDFEKEYIDMRDKLLEPIEESLVGDDKYYLYENKFNRTICRKKIMNA